MGQLFYFHGEAMNSGTGQDTLVAFNIPANTLIKPGDTLWLDAFGRIEESGNQNEKRVRVQFGLNPSTLPFDSLTDPFGWMSTYWDLRVKIMKTPVGLTGWGALHTQVPGLSKMWGGMMAENTANQLVLKITGQATVTGEIKLYAARVGIDKMP